MNDILKGVFVLAMLVVVLSLPVTCAIKGCFPDYSEGDRVGFVTKFSMKGVFLKSWEGSMNVGGFTVDSGGATSANVWEFSVEDNAVAAQVHSIMQRGVKAKLSYQQFLIGPVRLETKYVVNKVTEIGK